MNRFKQITENKKDYLDLLLIGDEQEDMIMKYLDRGDMFVLEKDGRAIAVCVVTDEGNSVCELKNIAVVPEYQRHNIGSMLIDILQKKYRRRYGKMILGTGDSPLTVPFYEKCGFRRTHIIKDFFTDNYDHPIYEGGTMLKDMICFEKELR